MKRSNLGPNGTTTRTWRCEFMGNIAHGVPLKVLVERTTPSMLTDPATQEALHDSAPLRGISGQSRDLPVPAENATFRPEVRPQALARRAKATKRRVDSMRLHQDVQRRPRQRFQIELLPRRTRCFAGPVRLICQPAWLIRRHGVDWWFVSAPILSLPCKGADALKRD